MSGTAAGDVAVLVVEDEELASVAHAAYVGRTPGFALAGVARSAREALVRLRQGGVDLVLLDMNLPDGHGLDLVGRMRTEGLWCDVIAVTAARDVEVVRRAVAQGVVLYLLKPFAYATFRTKLEQYADYRSRMAAEAGAEGQLGQEEVDRALGTLRPGSDSPGSLPKGMGAETLREVVTTLRTAGAARSATEVGEATGASRVTVRRYLEHLAAEGLVRRGTRYGGSGRPEVEYRWSGA